MGLKIETGNSLCQGLTNYWTDKDEISIRICDAALIGYWYAYDAWQ